MLQESSASRFPASPWSVTSRDSGEPAHGPLHVWVSAFRSVGGSTLAFVAALVVLALAYGASSVGGAVTGIVWLLAAVVAFAASGIPAVVISACVASICVALALLGALPLGGGA